MALKKTIILTSLFFLLGIRMAESREANPSQQLIREKNDVQLSAELSVDIFKQVPYQAKYSEQVPYDVEEAYTDYESYTDTERVCRTDYTYECRPERVCQKGPTTCTDVEECGTNRQGQRTCETHHVCREERENCTSHNVCHNVPSERCGYEQVVKTRPITRYRTVTYYRTEERCCVTKYRSEWDRQEQASVVVIFPNEATLFEGEKETIEIEMVADGHETQFFLHTKNSIYGYRIDSQKVQDQNVYLYLAMIPKYSQDDLGINTLENATVRQAAEQNEGGSFVDIHDSGRKPRVTSIYSLVVKEKISGAIIFSNPEFSEIAIGIPDLNNSLDYILQIGVKRTGSVLHSQIQFTKEFEISYERLDSGIYSNHELIKNISVEGRKVDAVLKFSDLVPWPLDLNTRYKITIYGWDNFLFINYKKRKLGEKEIDMSSGGELKISLLKDFGLSEDVLKKYFGKRDKIRIVIQADRTSSRLNEGQIVTATREHTLKIVD